MDFTAERNADIMRVFRLRLREASHVVMPSIFEAVALSPASRFWVSEERAAIVISAICAGKPMPRMRANKRLMFQEIHRRFLLRRSQNPDASLFQIVSAVVNEPAPQFYLTPRTVGEIIYRIKNGWYDRQPDRYKNPLSDL